MAMTEVIQASSIEVAKSQTMIQRYYNQIVRRMGENNLNERRSFDIIVTDSKNNTVCLKVNLGDKTVMFVDCLLNGKYWITVFKGREMCTYFNKVTHEVVTEEELMYEYASVIEPILVHVCIADIISEQ